jgi:phage terminase small subunit
MVSDRHVRVSNLDSLTDMQRIVVEELRRGRSWTAAARAAGYADPSGEVDRLRANATIIDAVIGSLQEKAAAWELLGEDARRVLKRNMGERHDDWCRSLKDADVEHGYADCNCWFAKVRASDANTAARITLEKGGAEAVKPKEEKQVREMSDEEAARLYLGDGPTSGGEAAPSSCSTTTT